MKCACAVSALCLSAPRLSLVAAAAPEALGSALLLLAQHHICSPQSRVERRSLESVWPLLTQMSAEPFRLPLPGLCGSTLRRTLTFLRLVSKLREDSKRLVLCRSCSIDHVSWFASVGCSSLRPSFGNVAGHLPLVSFH